ncbi:MAG: hypothetical protein EP330_11160 [Deltaproteobacteria bacterium]|nr:MAG: hypothetical protein EP330_11160 [Deltaproteobacteria bacterium]
MTETRRRRLGVALAALALASPLAGCPKPLELQDAEAALAQGDGAASVAAYQRAMASYLTPMELRQAREGMARAADQLLDARLVAIDAEHDDADAKAAALFALWREVWSLTDSTRGPAARVAEQSDAVLQPLWEERVLEPLSRGRLAEGLREANALVALAPIGSRTHIAYEQLTHATAEHFAEHAAAALEADAAVSAHLSHYFGGEQEGLETRRNRVRRVDIAYTYSGNLEGCEGSLPESDPTSDIQAEVHITGCSLSVQDQESIQQDYRYTAWVTERQSVEVCETILVGSNSTTTSGGTSCGWTTGAAGVLRFYECTETTTTTSTPVYEERCHWEEQDVSVPVERTGTRSNFTRESTRTVTGSARVSLPNGTEFVAPIDVSVTSSEEGWSAPDSQRALTDASQTRAQERASIHVWYAVINPERERIKQARIDAALSIGRAGGPESDNGYAEAALLGVADPEWLARIGIDAEMLDAALEEERGVAPSATPIERPPPESYTLDESWDRVTSDGRAMRGWVAMTWGPTLVRRQLPTYGRSSVGVRGHAAIAVFAASQEVERGFGPLDNAELWIELGAASGAATGSSTSTGLGAGYQLMYGYLGWGVGFHLGLRTDLMSYRVGDVGVRDASLPFVARLQVTPHARYPMDIEVYAGSILWNRQRRGLKAKVVLPHNWTPYVAWERGAPKMSRRDLEATPTRAEHTSVMFGVWKSY